MHEDEEPTSIYQQPELPKAETHTKPNIDDSEGLDPNILNAEEEAAKTEDLAKISETRASLGLEPASGEADIKQYFIKDPRIEHDDVERINILKVKDLPEHYQTRLKALNDERLNEIFIAIIPDDIWGKIKGSQPSQSHAEIGLISFRQSYFEAQNNPDEIAWLLHELAHCQNFLDSESPEMYQANQKRPAFKDLESEYPYPNNQVEQATFTKQFQYLKERGKSREDVLAMISKYYDEVDFPFFNRLLDNVFGE
ncbi:hypothetical protein KJ652_05620 [Patescibacteria group bacterium]|nr:hypothetical protein [Patescibacteria group bacterium]MBU1124040.1 hypothetical protein [Patescibacteria group bacterium]MBU1911251.1 hypothetical protein [Patescibacteria group bacterium]